MRRRTIILILIIAVISGCCSLITESRRAGFDTTARSFALVPAGKEFARSVELNIKVNIVSSPAQFAHKPYRDKNKRIAGYATSDGQIWIIGKMQPGGLIVVNQNVLGHELNHLLNVQNSKIADPDQLDAAGL